MNDVMISTNGLTKTYNGKAVVNNVTLEVKRGSIVGLVGQNGAGKTTLIRMLTGLIAPTSGTFELLGGAYRNNTDIAAIVERPSIYSNMTAMDNLKAQSCLLELPFDEEYLSSTLKMVGLDPASKKKAKNFSLGMKQRLAIAMTLVGKPKLLILDEPTNGLDPEGIVNMRDLFVSINKNLGVTIVISSHILSELGKFATEFFIMDRGNLLKHITATEIRDVNGKRARLKVDNVEEAIKALSAHGEVKTVADSEIELISDEPITQLLLALAQANVNVLAYTQAEDALESYYLDVVRQASKNGGHLC